MLLFKSRLSEDLTAAGCPAQAGPIGFMGGQRWAVGETQDMTITPRDCKPHLARARLLRAAASSAGRQVRSRGPSPCACRDSAKSSRNFDQMVVPAIAVQVS